MEPIVIIPSYNPSTHLLALVNEIKKQGQFPVIVIDDGSIIEAMPIFETLSLMEGIKVFHHAMNMGKGVALKTAMSKCLEIFPDTVGCITVDADGQHAPEDVIRVANQMANTSQKLILGCRNFNLAHVPFKSKWGNLMTSKVFKLTTGVDCSDTQTGLRGIPVFMMKDLIAVEGDRFDYEMNMLLDVVHRGYALQEVEIQTLYFDKNKSSHFNLVWDSLKIYYHIFRYSFAAASSAMIDFTIFAILSMLGGFSVFSSTIISRLVSGIYNFSMNKKFVFKSKGSTRQEGIKYFTLFLFQMLASASMVHLISSIIQHALMIKIIVDSFLFVFSYQIQKHLIFNHKLEGVRK